MKKVQNNEPELAEQQVPVEEQNEAQVENAEQQEAAPEDDNEGIVYSSDMLLDMTAEERQKFFDEHSRGLQYVNYEKELSEETLNDLKDDIYQLNIELMEVTEEKTALTKQYGDKMKRIQSQMNAKTLQAKKGTVDTYEQCHRILDLKNNRVYLFDQETGQCAATRRATDDDLQQEIPFVTEFNVVDDEGNDAVLKIGTVEGGIKVGDLADNENGDYTLENGDVVTVYDGKVESIFIPGESNEDEDDDFANSEDVESSPATTYDEGEDEDDD